MKVDYYLAPGTPLGYVEAEAFRAAALGYDGFFAAETAHEPFMPLVLAARAAPELTIGTAIALAFPRSPMITANIAWDLTAFTHGKVHPRARHASQGSHHQTILGRVAAARTAHARLSPRLAGDIQHMADG